MSTPAPPRNPSHTRMSFPATKGGSTLRQLAEFVISLCMAVAIFKNFAVEGYMITTGSMAPTLLGLHRFVVCPSCRFEFAVGDAPGNPPPLAMCPNCTQTEIDTHGLLRHEGDQLLVHRTAYEFREPRRWEVVVFRNPRKPTEAYVKRLIGLPGETLQIERGDIRVNGEIQRKRLDVQRSLRILVHDVDYPVIAADLPWTPRWQPESGWKWDSGTLVLQDATAAKHSPFRSVEYRHWIRTGGKLRSSQPLEQLPPGVSLSDHGFLSVTYNSVTKSLESTGALSVRDRDRLLALANAPEYRRAVEMLYERSHLAPVSDLCAYNAPNAAGLYAVPDLMLEGILESPSHTGICRWVFNTVFGVYAAEFDFDRFEIRLQGSRTGTPLQTAPLPVSLRHGTARIEFSMFDRQAVLAIDGTEVFPPVPLDETAGRVESSRTPVRIEGRGGNFRISKLKLFRDVYYTQDRNRPGEAYVLSQSPHGGQYFLLGDNSPVSVDSRYWSAGERVTRQSLLGKPFLVHLPARNQRWHVWGRDWQIRVPDFSRIRYIR